MDHVRNLSFSLESVVFLNTLLFDADPSSEVHMLVAKLFQSRRNHRIKHIEIKEIAIAISEVRPLTLLSQFL